MMLILETGLQERAARMSPGYSQSLTQTRSPESLTYVDEILHSCHQILSRKGPCQQPYAVVASPDD